MSTEVQLFIYTERISLMAEITTEPIVCGKWHLTNGYNTVVTLDGHVVEVETHSVPQRLDELLPEREQVARLEFIWNDIQRRRGVIAVTPKGDVIVHILGALIGYEGSGPQLSEAILKYLGIPSELFDRIQKATWNSQPYVLVVHRTGPSNWDWERIK